MQRMRREANFEITDRIVLSWMSNDPSLRQAITEFDENIRSEVLATSISENTGLADESFELDGKTLKLSIERAG